MEPIEAVKSFGWIAVAITWTAIAFLVYNWRGDRSMSISKHAAAHKSAYLMMLIIESIVLPMFFVFVAFWLAPTLELSLFFTAIVGIMSLGLLIAAWVPDIKGWKGIVHGLTAYGAALLMIPALTTLHLSPNISSIARNMALAVLVYELIIVTSFVVVDKARGYHLYLQGIYILSFDITLLVAGYIR